jgi:GT2 family glycosyltransferase
VLLKKEVFDKYNLCFDESYTTGGSDQAFFREAMRKGFRFIAVAEAAVYETIPPERLKKSYFITRALVNGYNAQKYMASEKRIMPRLFVPLKSICALAIYALITPFIALTAKHLLMRIAEKAAHHFSRLFAIVGIELIKERRF